MSFFPGKLLLFGEYTVLLGGQALAVPLRRFGGDWSTGALPASPDETLAAWHDYLLRALPEYAGISLDWSSFGEDIASGVHFVSDIPQGYGAGSSGALTAAAWRRYQPESVRVHIEQWGGLRDLLARMEAYFHGSSSGLDPLVSYLQRPIVALSSGDFSQPEIDGRILAGFCLADSGERRVTADWVRLFRARMELDADFGRVVSGDLFDLQEKAVRAACSGDAESLYTALTGISRIQRQYFEDWIPARVRRLWDMCTAQGIAVKLCGAGGGGFFLVYGGSEPERLAPLSAGSAGLQLWTL